MQGSPVPLGRTTTVLVRFVSLSTEVENILKKVSNSKKEIKEAVSFIKDKFNVKISFLKLSNKKL